MQRKLYVGIMVMLAAVGMLAIQPGSQKLPEGHGRRPSAAQLRARVSSIHLPLRFEINAGQADARAKFISRGRGYTLFLTSDEAVLALSKPALPRETRPSHSRMTAPSADRRGRTETSVGDAVPAAADAVRIKLLGSNSTVRVVGLEELPGKSNYFLGNDPKKWRTGVPNYAKVKYEGVYPGIDLVYYGNQRQLEYDFVVAPGADPQAIQFRLSEASGAPAMAQSPLRMSANEDLVLPTAGGDVNFQKPAIYQTAANGERVPVGGHYSVRANQQVGFEIASYDRTKPLVIDPLVGFSTYLGGDGSDSGLGIAQDNSGNVYVTGSTTSSNFPLFGPVQGALNGPQNAFVTEMTPDGSVLLYSTYIGGNGYDTGYGIALDAGGDAYVAGGTTSTDFPTVTPLQATIGSTAAMNGFVFKLGPDGGSLWYSTYLGGSGLDYCTAIAADNFGYAYVTGSTTSSDFPTTSNATQRLYENGSAQPSGPGDGFLTVVFTNLGYKPGLIYSTFLGGSNTDFGNAIAVYNPGTNPYGLAVSVVVTGSTYSTDFPTLNGYQGSNPSGSPLAFVTRLTPQGSGYVIAYSTYLGGTLAEGNAAMASGPTGVAVAGLTSANFPVVNAIQSTFGGGDAGTGGPLEDGFVAVFDTSQAGQASLVDSTYIGGSGNDFVTGITAAGTNTFWIVGTTDSSNFPTTHNALQPNYGGNTDAFVANLTFSPNPMRLYSSYLGGSGLDQGQAIAGTTGLFTPGTTDIYVTGSTCASSSGKDCGSGTDNFPTNNPLQNALLGSQNAFVAEFGFHPALTALPIAPLDIAVGASASVTVTLQSIDGFNGLVEVSLLGPLPAGLSVSAPAEVNLPANGTVSATLTITASSVATPATFSPVLELNGNPSDVAPVSVNVTATTGGVQAAISSFQGAGCIDNGTAFALSAELDVAQILANAGLVGIAINTDNAVLYEIRAESGKSIANTCTVDSLNLSPPIVLSNDVRGLMASLRLTGSADPIMGYVVNSSDVGVAGVTVGLFNSSANLVASATTDPTGFYYFASTASLAAGANYSVQVTGLPRGYSSSTPASQSFTWGAAPVALGDFTVN